MNQSVYVNYIRIPAVFAVQLDGYCTKPNQFSFLERKTSDFSVIADVICPIQCIIDPGRLLCEKIGDACSWN